MAALITIDIRAKQEWRAWLAKNHASCRGIWLVRYKPHSGVESMSYEDVVREALCFGWIDSLIKRLDDDRYVIKVTPRKPESKWSAINRRRWRELEAAGLLAAPGLSAAPTELAAMAVNELLHRLTGFRGTGGHCAERVRRFDWT